MLGSLEYLAPGTIVYCPIRGIQAACARFGAIVERPAGDLIGAKAAAFIHPEDLAVNQRLIERALATGRPFVLRKRYLLASGEARWVESRYTVLTSCDDAPLISMLCRRIEDPGPALVQPKPCGHASYVVDMSVQLAALAQASRLAVAADLLRLAAHAASDEEAVSGWA